MFKGTVEELTGALPSMDAAQLTDARDGETDQAKLDAISAEEKRRQDQADADASKGDGGKGDAADGSGTKAGAKVKPAADDGQGKTGATSKAADGTNADDRVQGDGGDAGLAKDHPEAILSEDGKAKPGDSPYVGVGEESRASVDEPADPPAASSVDYLDHSAPATDTHVLSERLERAFGRSIPH